MSENQIRISRMLNIMIVIMVAFAAIVMFSGFKFMHGQEPNLTSSGIGMLKYFTVESNIFMGIMALIFSIYETKLLKGQIKEISFRLYILKLMATTSVGLTFLVVFAYLGPISSGGIMSMLQNSNAFFHLLIPVLSMINFAIIEKTDIIKFKHCLLGVVPMLLYSIFYISNILSHIENGKVSPKYDWYWFVQGGLWQMFIVIPLIFGVTYLITLILWRLNRIKIKKNN